MSQLVCMGAMMTCSFGAAPSSLIVLPVNRVMTNNVPVANILDNKPMVNIPPFAMCSSLANPEVAAATSAAMGVLTPMPCVPVTVAPWTPVTTDVLIANMPALNNTCKLSCMWAGEISISQAGQETVEVS